MGDDALNQTIEEQADEIVKLKEALEEAEERITELEKAIDDQVAVIKDAADALLREL